MNKSIERFIIIRTLSIRDAMRQIDAVGERIALLVDNQGVLLRTITDGDIRRLLLAGCSLEDPIDRLPPLEPKSINESADSKLALMFMNEYEIDHLPVIDQMGRPIEILFRRDIDTPILLSTPHMSEYEREFVEDAFRSNWIAPVGPNIDAFEREIQDYVGVKHAAALSSGTAAIHLALHILDVKPGDIVFCSTLTFVASANPILYRGAKPVFIDSEPQTWNMSPHALAKALSEAEQNGQLPKVVIVVNLYGQSADYDPILELCDSYGVPVIEDAAESLGATYKNRGSGTLGVMGVYSFNGNKIITTSGGGMLVSNRGDYIERAKYLATQGREPVPYYEHREMAYNYRMSNVLAGIGRGQLKVLAERVASRQDIYFRYLHELKDLPINFMPEPDFGVCTHWLTAICLDRSRTSLSANEVLTALAKNQIEGRPIWNPMHRQPLFADCLYYAHNESGHSVSDEIFNLGLCLPSGSSLTEQQQNRVIDSLKKIFN